MREITITQAELYTGRAERPHTVEQWEGPDGMSYGVWLRALSAEERSAARIAALREVRKGVWEVDEWWLACEELSRGITRPAGIPAKVLATWNEAVIRELHEQLSITAFMVVHRVAGSLQAAMGEAPPPVPDPAAERGARRPRKRPAGGVGAGDSDAPGRNAA